MVPGTGVNTRATGSNSSAVESAAPPVEDPPATRTFPSARRLNEGLDRPTDIGEVVRINDDVNGSKISAVARLARLGALPPTTSALPSRSNIVLCAHLASLMPPTPANAPVAGSYSSAVLRIPLLFALELP